MERLKKVIEDAKKFISELDVGVRELPLTLLNAYEAATKQLQSVTYADLLDETAVKALLAMNWHDFSGSVENAINIWDGKASIYANKHIMVVELARTFNVPVSPGYLENE
jgi:hypothetical protein